MIALHINKVVRIQSIYKTEIKKQYDRAMAALLELHKNTSDPKDKQYVRNICMVFRMNPNIITALPYELENIGKSVPAVPVKKVKYTRNGNPFERNKKSEIWKKIVVALGYEKLRSEFYPEYFSHLGIKSCVYCNAQYTLSIEKKGRRVLAKYDVDHYRAKSDFPWRCISLFNLYPSCVPCNRAKSSNLIDFNLYSDITSSTSNFHFRLTPSAKYNYLTSKDSEIIEFVFKDISGTDHFDKMFSISSVYNTQRDLAEGLIVSSQMYDRANRDSLMNSFKKLHISKDVFNRVILGNYTEEKDIHKRPMSKFMQDIAKDLGIL